MTRWRVTASVEVEAETFNDASEVVLDALVEDFPNNVVLIDSVSLVLHEGDGRG